jgi:hypothetical protein
VKSQSTGKSSSSPPPEESDDEEALVEFDLNDPLGLQRTGGLLDAQRARKEHLPQRPSHQLSWSSGSGGGSCLDLLAAASGLQAEAQAKVARAHSGSSLADQERGPRKQRRKSDSSSSSSILAAAWGGASETLSPQRLERLVRQVPTDTLNLPAYGSLADQLIGSMGARSALSLTLALLGRSFPPPPAYNRPPQGTAAGGGGSGYPQANARAPPVIMGWPTGAVDAEAASQMLSEHLSSFGLGSPPPGSRI